MENTASKLMRDYVNSQKFSSTADIMEAIRDALQQVMEVELEEQLG